MATLSKPTTTNTFLPILENFQNFTNFQKFNFNHENWKNEILKKFSKKDQNVVEEDEEEEDLDVDDEIYVNIPNDYNFDIQMPLSSLDSKKWRDNDHYKLLGLNEFRWRTRPEDLKRAYRALVLKYHPDKGKIKQKNLDMNSIFSCITKSYELLCKPASRRSFDSYDPEFDDSIPTLSKKCDKDTFFSTFSNVFDKNSRWSRHLLPNFGDYNSSFDQVNDFYSAWYNFQSWREFTYEKLEELENAADRWERRGYQMQIKKENNQKRKDEVKRIRKLVDNAYNCDPRIKKFHKEDLAKKEAEKEKKRKEKEERLAKLAAIEAEKLRIEKEEQDEIEAELKKKREIEKKERDAVKKVLKRSRQNFRKACCEVLGVDAAASVESDISLICMQMNNLELDSFKDKVKNLNDIRNASAEIRVKLNVESEKQQKEQQKRQNTVKKEKEWSIEQLQLLVKATTIFPAGTTKRWDKLAQYVNDHSDSEATCRSARDAMTAVKTLTEKAGDSNAVKNSEDSFSTFLRERKRDNESKPQNGEISLTDSNKNSTVAAVKPWTPVEQKALERALKTFTTALGKDRWDKIAEAVGGRSKKECILRYKELAAAIAKKRAQVKK